MKVKRHRREKSAREGGNGRGRQREGEIVQKRETRRECERKERNGRRKLRKVKKR